MKAKFSYPMLELGNWYSDCIQRQIYGEEEGVGRINIYAFNG
jgi:hypothetical protein